MIRRHLYIYRERGREGERGEEGAGREGERKRERERERTIHGRAELLNLSSSVI